MIKDKMFSLSVSDELDSVVQTGTVGIDHKSIYFSYFEEAFEYIREQCKKHKE